MEKTIRYCSLFCMMVIIVMLANVQITFSQTGKEQSVPIPENINTIFQNSCISCHGNNGKMLPMAKLNFSKWVEYDAAKKADKASEICSLITNGSMPPKSIRKSQP